MSITNHADSLKSAPSRFLTALWGDRPPVQVLFWTKRQPATSFFDWSNVDAWVASRSDRDIYVRCGGLPLDWKGQTRYKRGLASDTIAIPGVWADIDVGTEGHSDQHTYPPTIDAALEVIDTLDFAPTIVVHSGHGLQVWWLFDEPWLFQGDEDRQRAAWLVDWWANHKVAAALKAEGWAMDATQDLARVMRVPGSYNNKSTPVPVKVLEWDGPRIPLAEWLEALPAQMPAKHARSTGGGSVELGDYANTEPPWKKIQALTAIHSDFAATWTRKRRWQGDQTASRYSDSIATFGAQNGWTDAEIGAAILEWWRTHEPERMEDCRPDRVQRWTRDARAKVDGDPDTEPPADGDPLEYVNSQPCFAQAGVEVTAVVKQGLTDAEFFLYCKWQGAEYEIPVKKLQDPAKTFDAFFNSECTAPDIPTPKKWRPIALKLKEAAGPGIDTHNRDRDRAMAWFSGLEASFKSIQPIPPLSTPEGQLEAHRAIEQVQLRSWSLDTSAPGGWTLDGRLWLHRDLFHARIKSTLSDYPKLHELIQALHLLEFTPQKCQGWEPKSLDGKDAPPDSRAGERYAALGYRYSEGTGEWHAHFNLRVWVSPQGFEIE